jgi:hypothetical protein
MSVLAATNAGCEVATVALNRLIPGNSHILPFMAAS